jgi:uncharacterized repeat protein (TIGR03803 family)
MRQQVRSLGWVLLLSICGTASYAADTYNGTELSIPTLIIGAGTYSDVVVVPAAILSVARGEPDGSVDSYDPANGQLFIPSVLVGSTTYTNVTITVRTLVSIGSVAGVDTFNGTQIIIPTVQLLNGPVFNTGVVTVGRIISAGGGMPNNIRDVFNLANFQLTIAAIEYNGKIYTNAVVYCAYATVAGEGIPVPSVVGDTQAAASAALTAIGLAVGTVTPQFSGTVADGDIISQSPPANEDVLSGTAINLAVSAGMAPPPPPTPESVLYSFGGPSSNKDGLNPIFLLQGPSPAYNFYGTAPLGGASNNGTVFELTSGGTESTIYAFPVPNSGTYSPNGLVVDGSLFYGTTASGGQQFMGGSGGGSLFSLTAAGVENQVYAFCGCIDNLSFFEGIQPNGLILSGSNFYGTTFTNGQHSSGTLFFVQPNGNGGVLYSFGASATDGQLPVGNLIQVAGNNETTFYGATQGGGTNGTGTVFSVNSVSGVESILYSFGPSSGHDAQAPESGLTLATNGNFYGMTRLGGTNNTGAIYEVTPSGTETVLYSFPAPVNSENPAPNGILVQAPDGNLYGVTGNGGSLNYGTIFKITPTGTYSLVYSFYENGGIDAIMPSYLILGHDGNLYGLSLEGGTNGTGTIFRYNLSAQ